MSGNNHPITSANISRNIWRFLGLFTLIFFISYSVLLALGIKPSTFSLEKRNLGSSTVTGIELPKGEGEYPVLIEIPSAGISANVNNPKGTDVASLDRALLSGAVRYPGSAAAGEKGNVLIFGHSSYLPVVHNQAYKAFNGIQDLKKGDLIYLSGDNKKYVYAVDIVEESNTTTGEIRLATEGAKLTLATCDTFGAKSDRFIVTATLVSIENIES